MSAASNAPPTLTPIGIPQTAEELLKVIENSQIKENMRMYNSLTERCFNDCIRPNPDSSKLSEKEQTCIFRCSEKFLKHTSKMANIFAEEVMNLPADPAHP